MPLTERISAAGSWGSFEWSITAPDYFIDYTRWTPALARRVQRVTGTAVERLIRAARRGFASDSFAVIPMQTGFRRLEETRPPGPYRIGLTNTDPIVGAVDSGAGPHWAPLNRGEPGTGLEGWAERHDVNVYALRATIAARGTPDRNVLRPLFADEAPRFAEDMRRAFLETANSG